MAQKESARDSRGSLLPGQLRVGTGQGTSPTTPEQGKQGRLIYPPRFSWGSGPQQACGDEEGLRSGWDIKSEGLDQKGTCQGTDVVAEELQCSSDQGTKSQLNSSSQEMDWGVPSSSFFFHKSWKQWTGLELVLGGERIQSPVKWWFA